MNNELRRQQSEAQLKETITHFWNYWSSQPEYYGVALSEVLLRLENEIALGK